MKSAKESQTVPPQILFLADFNKTSNSNSAEMIEIVEVIK